MSLELIYCAYLDEEDGKPQLSAEDKKRRDRRMSRVNVNRYSYSPFYYMFNHGDDQGLLNACAVDHKVFRKLLNLFAPLFNTHMMDEETGHIRKMKLTKSGKPIGRKREIDATGCLGMVLYWYRTRGSIARSTCWVFGLTSTPMYKWLKFSRRMLLFVLQHHPVAKIEPPSSSDVQRYADAISAKYPILSTEKVWGAADGLKLKLEKSNNWFVQNYFYNGWTCDTYVNSVFVFCPDGRIRICTINAPGSWHDSAMAEYGVYEKMEKVYDECGGKVVVDSAFNLQNKPYLIKSSQLDPMGKSHGVLINRAATSVRQLSEHGMRMIQGQFPRLKDRIGLEDFGERKVILNLMILLYNFQTGEVGINHILNSFMSRTKGFHSYKLQIQVETANDVFK